MKGILGVVVVYNPNIDNLIHNINRYIRNISALIIWQNSLLSDKNKNQILHDCENSEKIIFDGSGSNQGLDKAFNSALNIAIQEGYPWLLTMDQDSTWVNFDKYIICIRACDDDSIGVFGPQTINIYDDQSSVHESEIPYSIVDYVISSGALYVVDKLQYIGGFVSGYFIDAIDEEVCYRAQSFGIKTTVIRNAYLLQQFGEYSKKKILGKTIASSNYSSFRYYHIVRNHLWLAKSGYVTGKARKIMIRNYIILPIIKVILLEKNKGRKCLAMLKGLFEGLLKNLDER